MDPVSEAEPLATVQLPRVTIRFCTQLSYKLPPNPFQSVETTAKTCFMAQDILLEELC